MSVKNISKRGFTIAEIVIVLLVIGIIATLTVPNSMKGLIIKRQITAYKLAYKTVQQATEGIIEQEYIDKKASGVHAQKLWRTIDSYVVAQGYSCENISSTKIVSGDEINSKAVWTLIDKEEGLIKSEIGKKDSSNGCVKTNENSPWIILENGLAFSVVADISGGTMKCKSVIEINEQKTLDKTVEYSCAQVIVDVNGLNKGPNTGNSQNSVGVNPKVAVDKDTNLDEVLENDRFRIFVGYDGITAGPKVYTETGRIMYEQNI